ncbi:MAG: hypothetical protein K1X92_00495 [Bacteroidia bacterium]|nr:hypothetical protein [Bacteroidia bacterium]
MKNHISKQSWQELFSLALQFKQLAPWNWMNDSDLFAVQIPDSGVKYYCSIMGAAGEVFAIAMYDGTEGLDMLTDLAEFGVYDPFEMITSQKCLMVSFSNKEELIDEDLEVLKTVGLTFKGKNAYPTFHDYTPSYLPFPIHTEKQADTIKTILAQALIVAQKQKEDNFYLIPPEDAEEEKFLVRVQNESGEWTEQWLEPDDYTEEEEEEAVEISEIYLQSNLGKFARNVQKAWLMDAFVFPTPVQENPDERPYFPKIMMIVDAESGMIVAHEPFTATSFNKEFQKSFVKICKENNYVPGKILYGNPEFEDFLGKLCEALKIEIEEDEEVLEYFQEIKNDLYNNLDGFDDFSEN